MLMLMLKGLSGQAAAAARSSLPAASARCVLSLFLSLARCCSQRKLNECECACMRVSLSPRLCVFRRSARYVFVLKHTPRYSLASTPKSEAETNSCLPCCCCCWLLLLLLLPIMLLLCVALRFLSHRTASQVLRGWWGRPDAHITTDCGAVENMRGAPAFAPSDEHAAAWTINNGTDLGASVHAHARACCMWMLHVHACGCAWLDLVWRETEMCVAKTIMDS